MSVWYKLVLFSCISFLSSKIEAQSDAKSISSIDLNYGFSWYQKPFSGLKSFSDREGVLPAQASLSMTLEALADTAGNITGPTYLGFSMILPVRILYKDTLSLSIWGYYFSIPSLGKDLVKNSKVDLNIIPSLEIGRMQAKGENLIQRNGFFGGRLLIQQRVSLGRFVFGLTGTYFLDISQKHWKKLLFGPSQDIWLDKQRWHNLYYGASLGIRVT